MSLLISIDPKTDQVSVFFKNKWVRVNQLDQVMLERFSKQNMFLVSELLSSFLEKLFFNRSEIKFFFLRKDIRDALFFLQDMKEKKQYQEPFSDHLFSILSYLQELRDQKILPRSNQFMTTLIYNEQGVPLQVVFQDKKNQSQEKLSYQKAEENTPEVVLLFWYLVQKAIEDEVSMLVSTQKAEAPPPLERLPLRQPLSISIPAPSHVPASARPPVSPESPLSPDLLLAKGRRRTKKRKLF